MLLNIVLISTVVICIGLIIFIVVKKFPWLKTLDVETLPKAQRAKVRDRILLERIKRKKEKGKKIVKKTAAPLFSLIAKIFKQLFKKVYDLEKKYKKEAESKVQLKGADLENKIKGLLEEAEKLAKDEKFNEAEKQFIEIVSLDPKNIEAYKGLADVYLELKEHKQALQTAHFVLKLESKKGREIVKKDEKGQEYKTVSNASELADAYLDLGYVYQTMGKMDQALGNYQKALELEPNNPRNLSQMIEINVIIKNKAQALEMLKRLEEVNPENQKLKEYADRIAEL